MEAGMILDEAPYEIEGDKICGDHHKGSRSGRPKVPAVPLHHEDGRVMSPSEEESRRPFTGLWLCAFSRRVLLQM